MEIENESFDMEIENENESETPLSQRFSQSQGVAVQNDQEQIDRIDFSSLGDNCVVGEWNVYYDFLGSRREGVPRTRWEL